MDLKEAYEDYILALKVIDRKSKQTVNSYAHDIKVYIKYLEDHGIHQFNKIQAIDIDEFLDYYSTDHSAASCNRMLAAIHSFHGKTSLEANCDDISNTLHGMNASKHLPSYLTVDQINKLFDSFEDNDIDIYKKTLLVTLYACGLRVSELCSLKLNDVHLNENILKVKGKGNKERIVPIANFCIIQMQKYLEIRRKWDVKHLSVFFVNQYGRNCTRPARCSRRAAGQSKAGTKLPNSSTTS